VHNYCCFDDTGLQVAFDVPTKTGRISFPSFYRWACFTSINRLQLVEAKSAQFPVTIAMPDTASGPAIEATEWISPPARLSFNLAALVNPAKKDMPLRFEVKYVPRAIGVPLSVLVLANQMTSQT
jgi:hypothetical protein